MTDPRIDEVTVWSQDAAESWFAKLPAFDTAFRAGFADLHAAASTGELADWRDTSAGLHRAKRHRNIIVRFGGCPHRQPICDRSLTPEESQYLNSGGFQG